MRTPTNFKFLLAACLLLIATSSAIAKKAIEAGSNGIALRISSQEQPAAMFTISPDGANGTGTLEMPVSNDRRMVVSGVMTNAIEFRSAANGGKHIRFKLRNAAKGIYYLSVASAKGSSLSTMTLQ